MRVDAAVHSRLAPDSVHEAFEGKPCLADGGILHDDGILREQRVEGACRRPGRSNVARTIEMSTLKTSPKNSKAGVNLTCWNVAR